MYIFYVKTCYFLSTVNIYLTFFFFVILFPANKKYLVILAVIHLPIVNITAFCLKRKKYNFLVRLIQFKNTAAYCSMLTYICQRRYYLLFMNFSDIFIKNKNKLNIAKSIKFKRIFVLYSYSNIFP